MRKSIWNGTLIVVAPDSPRVVKFRFTGIAIWILALSFVLSFLTIAAFAYVFTPSPTADVEGSRLASENQQLKVKNLNVATGASKIEASVDRLEQQAHHIQELLDAE